MKTIEPFEEASPSIVPDENADCILISYEEFRAHLFAKIARAFHMPYHLLTEEWPPR